MAYTQSIRLNPITQEWEHWVPDSINLPGYWMPGLVGTIQGAIPAQYAPRDSNEINGIVEIYDLVNSGKVKSEIIDSNLNANLLDITDEFELIPSAAIAAIQSITESIDWSQFKPNNAILKIHDPFRYQFIPFEDNIKIVNDSLFWPRVEFINPLSGSIIISGTAYYNFAPVTVDFTLENEPITGFLQGSPSHAQIQWKQLRSNIHNSNNYMFHVEISNKGGTTFTNDYMVETIDIKNHPMFGKNLITNYDGMTNLEGWEIAVGSPMTFRTWDEYSRYGYGNKLTAFSGSSDDPVAYQTYMAGLIGPPPEKIEIDEWEFDCVIGGGNNPEERTTNLYYDIDLTDVADIIDRKVINVNNVKGTLSAYLGSNGAFKTLRDQSYDLPWNFQWNCFDRVYLKAHLLDEQDNIIRNNYYVFNPIHGRDQMSYFFRYVDFYIPIGTRKIRVWLNFERYHNYKTTPYWTSSNNESYIKYVELNPPADQNRGYLPRFDKFEMMHASFATYLNMSMTIDNYHTESYRPPIGFLDYSYNTASGFTQEQIDTNFRLNRIINLTDDADPNQQDYYLNYASNRLAWMYSNNWDIKPATTTGIAIDEYYRFDRHGYNTLIWQRWKAVTLISELMSSVYYDISQRGISEVNNLIVGWTNSGFLSDQNRSNILADYLTSGDFYNIDLIDRVEERFGYTDLQQFFEEFAGPVLIALNTDPVPGFNMSLGNITFPINYEFRDEYMPRVEEIHSQIMGKKLHPNSQLGQFRGPEFNEVRGADEANRETVLYNNDVPFIKMNLPIPYPYDIDRSYLYRNLNLNNIEWISTNSIPHNWLVLSKEDVYASLFDKIKDLKSMGFSDPIQMYQFILNEPDQYFKNKYHAREIQAAIENNYQVLDDEYNYRNTVWINNNTIFQRQLYSLYHYLHYDYS